MSDSVRMWLAGIQIAMCWAFALYIYAGAFNSSYDRHRDGTLKSARRLALGVVGRSLFLVGFALASVAASDIWFWF